MSVSIKDKVALVTGANRGIGKAIVEAFIEQGAKKVYLAVRDPETTTELEFKHADKVQTLQVDMANANSIAALADKVSDLDIIVNNAGVLELTNLLEDQSEAALDKQLSVNLYGLLRISNALVPVIEKNGGGALVQLNSVASIKNFSGVDFYSASKAAAYSITQGLKEKLKDKNITVLSVHPGPIDTDMAAQVGFPDGASPASVAQAIVSSLNAGDFHLFPDPVSKDFESAYQSYSDALITAE
ncbi:SDR family oxidoreductase [Shewanella surugensis]|uniref:SDR family oxidoreductase n=1 Tax=Shewanella surugensis TaxID=212020 RepID=A0ABT0L6Z0_9GAMM|nr:SDR family oxidoreductase [Shewanella surugensis]MCL1123255.1 SDR family oxidoreductase [Shewanella surugensis]